MVQPGDAGDGGDHHAGKKLHGGYVAFVEGARRRREHFEHTQSPAVVAEGRDKNRADPQAAAAGQVNAGVAFGVVAEHDFAGAHGFGGDAGVGLQADTQVGCGAAGAGAADDLIAGTQGDGGAGGAGEVLGAFGDGADGWFKIEFGGANVDLFSGMHDSNAGDGMGGIGDAELAAKRSRGHAGVMVRNVEKLGIGDCAQQVADETVEFRIGDEMRRLLLAKGSPQNAGKAEQRRVAAGEAIRAAVGADQFALDAKRCRLERDEINVLESRAINRLAKHDYLSRHYQEKNQDK